MARATTGTLNLAKPGHKKARWTSWLTAYGFLLLALLLFVFFELYSLGYNLYIGFHDWNGFGTPEYVGLNNYKYLADDELFWEAFKHNIIFMVVALAVMTVLSLFIALVLDSGMPGAGLFRGLLFLPVIVPTVVVGLAWTRVFSTQGGLLNESLGAIGLASWQHDWLGNPDTALPAVLVVWVWRHMGYGIVMFSAGLLGIPDDLKEAAALDGASQRQTVLRIIVPLLRPIILIVALWFTIYSFKVFTLIFIMTGGGPYGATEVMNTYMYYTVFRYYDLGLGSAIANFGILILVVFAIIRRFFRTDFEF
jgi:raffinose/stachyose/melibiose transport system permease protein